MQLSPWHPMRNVDDIFGWNMPFFKSRLPSLSNENVNGVVEWSPSADISETKKEYLVKAELPDVEKSDIHVSVENGVLTLEGERKQEKAEDDETYHRVERFHGTFSRSFSLPSNIDVSKVHAKYDKGILRVHLPKTKETAVEKVNEIKID